MLEKDKEGDHGSLSLFPSYEPEDGDVEYDEQQENILEEEKEKEKEKERKRKRKEKRRIVFWRM
jgi:hypothetical protein